jgi:uncharacterized protein
MTPIEMFLLLLAAMGAGAINAVVGAGTIVTFTTLLAFGLPPVTANVSSTVGLVPGNVAGAYAYRETLRGQGQVVRRLVVASALGGITGGALLLALPARAFEIIVPVLLILSGVLAALQPRVAAAITRRRMRAAAAGGPAADGDADAVTGIDSGTDEAGTPVSTIRVGPLLVAGVAATGVYGGYFGAAQGVILLALLGVFVGGDMNRVNGIKNILAFLANLLSASLFVAIADVRWPVVAIVAVGSTLGGGLGGRYGRRLPAPAIRGMVVVIAFVAAVWQIVR